MFHRIHRKRLTIDRINPIMPILRTLKFLVATVPFTAQTFAMQNPDAQLSLENCCSIVELRQYTLHPGQRGVLIDLFDREFVESQEALGMKRPQFSRGE